MNRSLKVFIAAVVIGIGHVYYVVKNPPCENVGECWGAVAMGPIILGIIGIPLLFGLAGAIFSHERRIIRALSWFAIAFVVLIVLNVVAAQW